MKKKEKPKEETILFSELRRLCTVNSRRIPKVLKIRGKRYVWVGVGLVDEGELKGDEVRVVDDGKKK